MPRTMTLGAKAEWEGFLQRQQGYPSLNKDLGYSEGEEVVEMLQKSRDEYLERISV